MKRRRQPAIQQGDDHEPSRRPFCRDCADYNGVCPHDGRFCSLDVERRHKALLTAALRARPALSDEERAAAAPVPEGPDALGLSIDMLDADRLRQYAQNLLTYGPDITHWASLPHVVSKLQTLATCIEKAVRDIGVLRAKVKL